MVCVSNLETAIKWYTGIFHAHFPYENDNGIFTANKKKRDILSNCFGEANNGYFFIVIPTIFSP